MSFKGTWIRKKEEKCTYPTSFSSFFLFVHLLGVYRRCRARIHPLPPPCHSPGASWLPPPRAAAARRRTCSAETPTAARRRTARRRASSSSSAAAGPCRRGGPNLAGPWGRSGSRARTGSARTRPTPACFLRPPSTRTASAGCRAAATPTARPASRPSTCKRTETGHDKTTTTNSTLPFSSSKAIRPSLSLCTLFELWLAARLRSRV